MSAVSIINHEPGDSVADIYSAARDGFDEWSSVGVSARVRRLGRAADFVHEHIDEMASGIREENGKPIVEAIGHELLPAVAYVRWLESNAASILESQPRSLKWLPHRAAEVARRPFGTVLVISPWNIPFFIPFSQVLGALAAGNSVVLKPSEVTPETAVWIERALEVCDLPEGTFQLVQGDGRIGAELVGQGPNKVLFTGSVATGRKVMAACAERLIPVSLELGGVDAVIVRGDADLEYAASAIAWGGTFNHGQVCASVERVIAHESVYDELRTRIVDKMERINPWDDLARVTFGGQRKVLDAHLADARSRGLEICCGGEWITDEKLSPTLVAGDGIEESDVWMHESFGPVIAMCRVSDDDEAVQRHNGIEHGLTASIFSRDLDTARRLGGRLEAGNISINDIAALHYSQPELPWGGVGSSGFGRSHGPEGLLAVTWPQVIESSKVGAAEPKRPWFYPYDVHVEDALKEFTGIIAARGAVQRVRKVASTAAGIVRAITSKPRI